MKASNPFRLLLKLAVVKRNTQGSSPAASRGPCRLTKSLCQGNNPYGCAIARGSQK
jgi:hypothetical protein